MADTKTKIEALSWQRGFTNMAQALALADTMLDQDGREGMQSAFLVISDGELNFEFEKKCFWFHSVDCSVSTQSVGFGGA